MRHHTLSLSPSFNSGHTMVVGAMQKTRGHYTPKAAQEIERYIQNLTSGKPVSIVERNELAKQLAFKKIESDPRAFFQNAFFYKWPLFLFDPAGSSWSLNLPNFSSSTKKSIERAQLIGMILFGALISFYLLLVILRLLPLNEMFFLSFLIIMGIGSTVILTEINSHYHLVILPCYWVCSGIALKEILELFQSKGGRVKIQLTPRQGAQN